MDPKEPKGERRQKGQAGPGPRLKATAGTGVHREFGPRHKSEVPKRDQGRHQERKGRGEVDELFEATTPPGAPPAADARVQGAERAEQVVREAGLGGNNDDDDDAFNY